MGLRINTNAAAMAASRQLSRNAGVLAAGLRKLSTGLRVNSAADDAAGLAVAEGFRAQVLGTAAAQRNAQDGINVIQTAEGALAESGSIVQRIRELALQSANGTLTVLNRRSIQREASQLLGHIDRIALDTQFNGLDILNNGGDIRLQVGYRSGQQFILQQMSATVSSLNLDLISLSSQAGAMSALTILDEAVVSIAALRGALGARENRLEYTINTLALQEEAAAESQSSIRDTDYARETASFTKARILAEASTMTAAQANLLPQAALSLIT